MNGRKAKKLRRATAALTPLLTEEMQEKLKVEPHNVVVGVRFVKFIQRVNPHRRLKRHVIQMVKNGELTL